MTGPISNQGPLTNGKQTATSQDGKTARAKNDIKSDAGGDAQVAKLSSEAVKLNVSSGDINTRDEAARMASSLRQSLASNASLALAAFGQSGDAHALQRLAGE